MIFNQPAIRIKHTFNQFLGAFRVCHLLDAFCVVGGHLIKINWMYTSVFRSFAKQSVNYNAVIFYVTKAIRGTVFKSLRGKTVKYMLRETYNKLMADNRTEIKKFGYGDYRDKVKEMEEQEQEKTLARIKSAGARTKYVDMW